MSKHIGGIQQIGIGTGDLHQEWSWYRKNFGMDIRIFEDAAEAPLMTPYTGEKVQKRVAALAMNLEGGGGFEIWQYTSRTPVVAEFPITISEIGFLACKMKTRDADKAYQHLKNNGASFLSEVRVNPIGQKHFYLNDKSGNLFEIVEAQEFFKDIDSPVGGVYGCLIGVSDMEKSISFYKNVLDFDLIKSDEEGVFQDFSGLPGSNQKFRRVILEKSQMPIGPFAPLLGTNQIELIEPLEKKGKKVFENRFWGDLGFIHLCFDVQDMDGLRSKAEALNHSFTVDSANSFDMGKAAGRFAYVEDPDGALIEFVETHKLPIVEKWGWYLNLKKRSDQSKSLPKWLLSCFRFNRVKD